jgi:hypothetical protein
MRPGNVEQLEHADVINSDVYIIPAEDAIGYMYTEIPGHDQGGNIKKAYVVPVATIHLVCRTQYMD